MKKIPTIFVRDDADRRYVTSAVTPGCEWVLAGEGVATRKFDGTCVMIDRDSLVWARREIKPGKGMPPGFREVEHDETTGKRVGWEPASQSSFAALIDEARRNEGPGTYELVGPKINGNPEKYTYHALIPHGITTMGFETVGRDYDSLREFLLSRPEIEGLVFWRETGNPDAGMAKIKRRDFPVDAPLEV